MRKRKMGSARVSRAGDGVSPSRTFIHCGSHHFVDPSGKSSFWRDAKTNTRDACVTQNHARAVN